MPRLQGIITRALAGDSVICETKCPHCKENQTILANAKELDNVERLEAPVQSMKLTDDQREALLTGTCSKCWDEMWAEEQEEY